MQRASSGISVLISVWREAGGWGMNRLIMCAMAPFYMSNCDVVISEFDAISLDMPCSLFIKLRQVL
jgi:hypothetical protein